MRRFLYFVKHFKVTNVLFAVVNGNCVYAKFFAYQMQENCVYIKLLPNKTQFLRVNLKFVFVTRNFCRFVCCTKKTLMK